MRLPVDPAPLVFETPAGRVSFDVEVANTDESRSAGLMHRVDLPSNRAMLFVFDQTRDVMMWMENTPLPLDMVFIADDGKVSAIAPNTEPFSRAIVSSRGPVRFVVELNAGTAKRLGIGVGNTVQHPVIASTLGKP